MVYSVQEIPCTPFDRADVHALGLQNRSLLDVQLDEGTDVRVAAVGGAVVTNLPQAVSHRGAVDTGRRQRLLGGQAADEDETAHHVRGETRALLVGEEGDGDGMLGLDAGVVEGLDRLQAGENAEVAVEAATGAHGVDVRAGHHRRAVAAAGPHADDVADAIDGHGQARLAASSGPPGRGPPCPRR